MQKFQHSFIYKISRRKSSNFRKSKNINDTDCTSPEFCPNFFSKSGKFCELININLWKFPSKVYTHVKKTTISTVKNYDTIYDNLGNNFIRRPPYCALSFQLLALASRVSFPPKCSNSSIFNAIEAPKLHIRNPNNKIQFFSDEIFRKVMSIVICARAFHGDDVTRRSLNPRRKRSLSNKITTHFRDSFVKKIELQTSLFNSSCWKKFAFSALSHYREMTKFWDFTHLLAGGDAERPRRGIFIDYFALTWKKWTDCTDQLLDLKCRFWCSLFYPRDVTQPARMRGSDDELSRIRISSVDKIVIFCGIKIRFARFWRFRKIVLIWICGKKFIAWCSVILFSIYRILEFGSWET